jgi:hypothetical protein
MEICRMPRHPAISHARHAQGLAAYRSGQSIRELIGIMVEFDMMHARPDLTNEQHEEIEAAGPSLIAGYADGLIEDIRFLAGQRRGGGQRA